MYTKVQQNDSLVQNDFNTKQKGTFNDGNLTPRCHWDHTNSTPKDGKQTEIH
jgi:hypothetical protein